MKSVAEWLIAVGAVAILIAFLLPVISVPSTSASFSLFQIAKTPNLFFLYLFPLGALITLILTPFSARDSSIKNIFLIGQVTGLGISLLLLVGILAYFAFWYLEQRDPLSILPSECKNFCEVWPGFGFLMLLFGFGISAFGLLAGYFPMFDGSVVQRAGQDVIEEDLPLPVKKIDIAAKKPRLEIQKGDLANQTINVTGNDFSIGRSKTNELQLTDPSRTISRVHAQIRFAQNAWFIQDQDSKIGTFVNGKRIEAARLSSGDEIRIGDYTIHFRLDVD